MQHIPGMSFHKAMKERDRILTTIDQLIEEFFIKNLGQKLRLLGVDLRQGDGNRMLTRDEIKNNVLFLMFAGHDTTYTSILTLIYHLSQGPDAMEEIVEEVTKWGEPLQSDELKSAPVLNACIDESWRIDTPVNGGFRKAAKEIEHKGYSFALSTVFNYSTQMVTTDESIRQSWQVRHDAIPTKRSPPVQPTSIVVLIQSRGWQISRSLGAAHMLNCVSLPSGLWRIIRLMCAILKKVLSRKRLGHRVQADPGKMSSSSRLRCVLFAFGRVDYEHWPFPSFAWCRQWESRKYDFMKYELVDFMLYTQTWKPDSLPVQWSKGGYQDCSRNILTKFSTRVPKQWRRS